MSSAKPLEGVKVVDLTQYLAGPYCTMLMSDLGASVVKVEKPKIGDDCRQVGTTFIDGMSVLFATINRGKGSLELDLKTEDDRRRFIDLVKGADVVVENFRPGTMERLGLSFEELQRHNAELIYVAVAGYGQTGPLAKLGGFNLVLQAESGLLSITGHPQNGPAAIPLDLLDTGTGVFAALGAISALYARSRTGKGSRVDASLLDTAIGWMIGHVPVFQLSGKLPEQMGTADKNTVPSQAFRAKDGWIAISTGSSQSLWCALCEVLQLGNVSVDPSFATNEARVANRAQIVAIIEEQLQQKSVEDWVQTLRSVGVPVAPVNSIDQAIVSPQVIHNEMLPTTSINGITVRMPAVPIKFDGVRPQITGTAPKLGESQDLSDPFELSQGRG